MRKCYYFLSGLCHFISRSFLSGDVNISMSLFFRVIGMRNTPYVAGRRINLVKEILPVAAPSVMKQIVQHQGQFLGEQILPIGAFIFIKRSTTSSLSISRSKGLALLSAQFQFHAVWGKNGQHNRLALSPLDWCPFPVWEILDPPLLSLV